MHLTHKEFSTLTEIEQRKILAESGEILIVYHQGAFKVTLFKVNDIFVKIRIIEGEEPVLETFKDLYELKLFEQNGPSN